MYKNMIPVAEHASEIRNFLDYTKHPHRWLALGEWLMVSIRYC